MDKEKPQLIAFSQHLLGGVQSFYYNLLSNDADEYFRKKWLLIELKGHTATLPPAPFNLHETVIKCGYADEVDHNSAIIESYIDNTPGIILTNHSPELECLVAYPKPEKVIICLVHDHLYYIIAKKYIAIIDVLVTHNYELYKELRLMFPWKWHSILYLPYGINLSKNIRKPNADRPLKIAFVGRLCIEKGIFDLVRMDDLLKEKSISVNWLITGDGPEKSNFLEMIKHRPNFEHQTFDSTSDLFDKLVNCDVFILPSVLDGTPVALLEAMSVGLVPVIYRFNEGIKKVVTSEVGYIVEVGNVKQAVSVIKKLNDHRDLLETKSQNARASAQDNYDVKKRAAAYYMLFARFEEFKERRVTSSNLKMPPKVFFAYWLIKIPSLAKRTVRKIRKIVNGKQTK
jgi:glycosyltransferase involved in cell wall biosynthesis